MQYKVNFSDGNYSLVDKNVFNLINNYKKLFNKLPNFYDLTTSINLFEQEFLDFYSFILLNRHVSKAQLFQDLFVLFVLDQKREGKFLEFGATNGRDFSNSFVLEKDFGWQGVLAEPSPQWHEELFKNRPNCNIIKDCIYSHSGKDLEFFVSQAGLLSTLADFKYSDQSSMPGNAEARNKNGYSIQVSTISLNEVFRTYFNSQPIDYMSVDTEGSELLILENFDFKNFGPEILTIEHNFSDSEFKLDTLLAKNNYRRVFKEHSQFDGWYVKMK